MKRLLLNAAAALSLASGFAQTNFQFEKTCFRGAFAPAPASMWTDNWTEWDPQNKNYPAPTVTVASNITSNTTWVSGQTYLLTGPIYVKNNSVLTIQPGVVVLGDKSATGAALIITKGSQLIANGTINQPIVFTSNQATGLRNLGDWGGVVLLGKASNNNSNGVNNIEGLPISADTEYGGGSSPDDNDNSGSLRYVRIEFGGYVYQPNQEINGLTFGAVGRGTTIDFVQVSFSNDDAYEWFGGTVNCRHLVSFRNLDDDFDTDNGFSGKVQFGLAVRDPQLADAPAVSTSEFFESDNDPTGTSATPKTSAIFSNMTCIGPLRGTLTATVANGHRNRARIRRNSELKIYNSVMTDQATRGLFIDGSACENNANNNLLRFRNNVLGGYAGRATEQGTFNIINANNFIIAQQNDTLGRTTSASALIVNPYNYTAPDYRPLPGSILLMKPDFSDAAIAVATSSASPVVAASIPSTACIGTSSTTTPLAFISTSTISPNYCSISWTASPGIAISNTAAPAPTFTVNGLGTFSVTLTVVNENGTSTVPLSITTTTCLDVSIGETVNEVSGVSVYPNPAAKDAVVRFSSNASRTVFISVTDITGKAVIPAQRSDANAGENNLQLSCSSLQNGIYFITLDSGTAKETIKFIVNH